MVGVLCCGFHWCDVFGLCVFLSCYVVFVFHVGFTDVASEWYLVIRGLWCFSYGG